MTTISRTLCTILFLVTALWLGSLAHLMLSVGTLFSRFPKQSSNVAMEAAPALFAASEPVHLVLAIIAVLAALIWKFISRTRGFILVSALLMIGLVFASISIAYVTPQIDALREAGKSSSDEFDFWHRASTKLYMIQFLGVLGAVIVLPWALLWSGKTTPATDQS